jgi:multimeric flavodoxin WrbA/nitrite reductase/ring-hydroxylating ferredoxin subunit
METASWADLGALEDLRNPPVRTVRVGRLQLAVSFHDGRFGVISNACNHVGGPLGEGSLEGDYVVCPWHAYKFHFSSGAGEPGFEADRVPAYETRIEGGRLMVNLASATPRNKLSHAPHPLARQVHREAGPIRLVGISTTVQNHDHPRYSTSEALLQTALAHAAQIGCETRLIKLNDLSFRACEGYYSKSARACTWPCSITQMDGADQLDQVYEAFVHWADVIVVATPIRWGAASSLYYRMVERMNCIQNQVTIANRVLLKNKVAAFIILGGQDNIQGVAGQMLGFFAEVGCVFPQFPYIAHSRGWAAEDMERNVAYVKESADLHQGARALVDRAAEMAKTLLHTHVSAAKVERAGRKAFGGPLEGSVDES